MVGVGQGDQCYVDLGGCIGGGVGFLREPVSCLQQIMEALAVLGDASRYILPDLALVELFPRNLFVSAAQVFLQTFPPQ